MHNLAWLGVLAYGLMSIVPLILVVAVIIDVARTGAGWYWIVIALLFPFVGPIAYFLVERSPWFGSTTGRLTASAARRRGARRRLRELQIQLGHWRGPALLVEAGESLLLLGKVREAEAHLREACERAAEVEAANLPLARALEAQGRYAEAVPFLEELAAAHPDFKLGEADLCLARCLDESDRPDEAEVVLRRVLERHHFSEAQVRLARICMQSGRETEAHRLLDTVICDAAGLPKHVLRQARPWIRAARRIKRGAMRLPQHPSGPGASRRRMLLIAAAVLVLATLVLMALAVLLPGMAGDLDGDDLYLDEPQRLGFVQRVAPAPAEVEGTVSDGDPGASRSRTEPA